MSKLLYTWYFEKFTASVTSSGHSALRHEVSRICTILTYMLLFHNVLYYIDCRVADILFVINPIWYSGICPLLISKSTNSILMALYPTLYKNCSHYRSAICFKIGLGLAEIIRCL